MDEDRLIHLFQTKFIPMIEKVFEPRFNKIDERLATIETRLTNVETRLTKVENYIKKKADAYEEQSLNALQEHLIKSIDVGKTRLDRIYLKIVYKHNGSHLTDLDGCLLLDKNFLKLSREQISKRIQNATNNQQKQALQNNLKKWKDDNILYVVESKNHIIKTEVDKKILQMIEFQCIIQKLKKGNVTKKHRSFEDMVSNYGVDKFTDNIHLYLASDCVSPSTREYISEIYAGTIDEKTYKSLTFRMLEEFGAYKEFITDVRRLVHEQIITCPTDITDYDSFSNTLQSIRSNKNLDKMIPGKRFDQGLNLMLNFIKPFDKISKSLLWAKGRIGLIYQGYVVQILSKNVDPYNSSMFLEEPVSQDAPTSCGALIP